jgi:hypothetical protein
VRWHWWTVFALSVLAGIGVQAWGKGKWRIFWTRLATAGCIGAALLAWVAVPRIMPDLVTSVQGVAVLIAAIGSTAVLGAIAGALTLLQPEKGTKWEGWGDLWALVVLIVIAADLGWAAWGLNPTVPAAFYEPQRQADTTRTFWTEDAAYAMQYETHLLFSDYRVAAAHWQAFRASHIANLNLLDRAYQLTNFDPLLVGHYKQFLELVEAHPAQRVTLLQAADVTGIYAETGALETVNEGAPRAWLVSAACWHTDETTLTQAMLDSEWQPYQQVHLLGDGGCAQATDNFQGDVSSLHDEGNVLAMQVDAVRDSWLIVADTYYPGWVATVDGEEVYVYRANVAFRAIQVSAGEHVVRFEYRPWWLLPSILVSAMAALGLLLMFRLRIARDE